MTKTTLELVEETTTDVRSTCHAYCQFCYPPGTVIPIGAPALCGYRFGSNPKGPHLCDDSCDCVKCETCGTILTSKMTCDKGHGPFRDW